LKKGSAMRKQCGTYAGAQHHWRKKEIVCEPCRQAVNQRNKEYRANNPEWHQNITYKNKYNITTEEYNSMLEAQNHTCALCGRPEFVISYQTNNVLKLAVDHDHSCCPGVRSCGKCVRGLLCMACNRAIGVIESSSSLEKLIAYLRRNNEN